MTLGGDVDESLPSCNIGCVPQMSRPTNVLTEAGYPLNT